LNTTILANVHPYIVHFPIALLVTYSILEITGIIFKKEFISKSALLILCLGVITALAAVFTGNLASEQFSNWTNESKALMIEHQSFATYLLWFVFLFSGFRIYLAIKKKFSGVVKYIFIILALIVIFLVYETGIRGGNLVKKFGVGTEMINSLK
jgi:uncharacterized membrane protein